MKRRNVLILLILIIITTFIVKYKHNPYSGSYIFKSNRDIVLRLNNDDTFMMFFSSGKRAEYMKGKYKITEDKIRLTFDKDSYNIFPGNSINNSFEGNIDETKISLQNIHAVFIKK